MPCGGRLLYGIFRPRCPSFFVIAHAGPFYWQFVFSALEHASKRLVRCLLEFSEKCIFGDGANTLNTPMFENSAMANNILDARTSLLPVYISLAVETDRLVYVFNDFVIGECQQMSTQ